MLTAKLRLLVNVELKTIKAMIANIVIQSTDNSGLKIGDFLRDNKTGLQITPTFPDFIDLINYNFHAKVVYFRAISIKTSKCPY